RSAHARLRSEPRAPGRQYHRGLPATGRVGRQAGRLAQADDPRHRPVIVLWDATSADQFEAVVAAAKSLNLPLKSLELRDPPYDYESALAAGDARPGDALFFTASG